MERRKREERGANFGLLSAYVIVVVESVVFIGGERKWKGLVKKRRRSYFEFIIPRLETASRRRQT